MRRRVISERLRIIACVLEQGARVDNPPGWHGVFWRAGDTMRCDLEGGCQNHRRHLRKRVLQKSPACKSLFAWYHHSQARTPALCLSSSPPLSSPLSPLLPSLPSPPLRSRSRSPPPSAALPALALALAHAHGWHAVVGHRCLIRKQNCWVSATRGLRHQRFDRSTAANPAPALGKHQLEQSSTLERWLLRSNFACLGDLES